MQDPTLKIATWNVNRPPSLGYDRRGRIDAAIHENPADIWVLTETRLDLTPGGCSHSLATADYTDYPHKAGEKMVMIWSGFEIEPIKIKADPTRAVAGCIRQSGRPPIIVYGTVLPWRSDKWDGNESKNGVAYMKALEQQKEDWDDLIKRHPGCDLVVTGDFNQNLSEKHFYGSKTKRDKLNEVFGDKLFCLTAGKNDPIAQYTSERLQSVDHIIVSTGLNTLVASAHLWPENQNSKVAGSDHYGIRVEFNYGN